MTAVWIAGGLLVLGVVWAVIGRAHGRGRPADLGSVSDHWVAEHRMSQGQDSDR